MICYYYLQTLLHLFVTYFMFFISIIHPILWLPHCILRCIANQLSRKAGYGKKFSALDGYLEEDIHNERQLPRKSIVASLKLEGDMTQKELCDLFTQNVLQARTFKKRQVRYPEFRQYQTSYMGFSFWKDDPNFKIENHIFERSYPNGNFPSVAKFHEELQNKTFKLKMSPWDIIVIRYYSDPNEKILVETDEKFARCTTLLMMRFHHTMGDARSLLKLIVECLGQKPLNVAQPVYVKKNLVERFLFYLLFPVKYFSWNLSGLFGGFHSRCHPWRAQPFPKKGNQASQLVGISPKLPLSEIKRIAKANGVTAASVIVSVITGAVSQMGLKLREKSMRACITQPRGDHPEALGNHLHMGLLNLPTNEELPLERIKKCHKEYANMKRTEMVKYIGAYMYLCGSLANPIRSLVCKNMFSPVFITNIAGEEHEFSIGTRPCSEFLLSCGILGGTTGVMFCCFSYKGNISISVIADGKILSQDEMEQLANAIERELLILKA